MIHVDLFSGIGGFSLAFDNVFYETKNTHIFCDNDPFCQAVLRKHWPDAEIIGDIRAFTDSYWSGSGTSTSEAIKNRKESGEKRQHPEHESGGQDNPFLLTGGFPCQPFSQAGRRKGTEDDRHLWPEMLRVIQLTKPEWVIAENVRGLLTIGGGVVFEQVCTDLESAGYEVQPIVIPAVAKNAPHRRDRVWFVANYTGKRLEGATRQSIQGKSKRLARGDNDASRTRLERGRKSEEEIGDGNRNAQNNAVQSNSEYVEGKRKQQNGKASNGLRRRENIDWGENWLEVATRLCRVDDGLPRRMDRNPRLKALGNAIVSQVAEEIMRAIKIS